MKVKDYGSNTTSTKEKLDASFSPADIDMNSDIINKNILNGFYISKMLKIMKKYKNQIKLRIK